VVRVTGNFTSEAQLHHAARAALLEAFDQGWADPKKLSQSSARAAILRNHAIENIASRLGVAAGSIEILGEPSLGHFLGISGLLRKDVPFAYSAIDKGKIRAVARAHQGISTELSVDSRGQILLPDNLPADSVISLQLANGETGVIQNLENFNDSQNLLAVDATSSGPRVQLPARWDTALFDSQSWMGPSGLGILAINNAAKFNYPLPHIAPIRSPGSYSLPLLLASSVALENFIPEDSSIRDYAIDKLASITNSQIVAPQSLSLPHIFSMTISAVAGENVIRRLAELGFSVDSGSACSPEDLQPSHVLAAMGYETTGHLRFTLHAGTSRDQIDALSRAIGQVVLELRS
jgi:cysteine desulfurase